jgi:hypothetical protein
MRLAFAVCLAQFLGMGGGIFYFAGWDVVEPVTFLVSAFWLMAGSGFYLRHRVDFSVSGPFDYFQQTELEKLIKQNNFDKDK